MSSDAEEKHIKHPLIALLEFAYKMGSKGA
jgi:hypothetical protein